MVIEPLVKVLQNLCICSFTNSVLVATFLEKMLYEVTAIEHSHLTKYLTGETQVEFYYELITGNAMCLTVRLTLAPIVDQKVDLSLSHNEVA